MERQTITVDISPRKGIVPQLRVSQGDIGRPLGVYVMQDGAALDCSGYTADLYVLKADGNYYVVHVTVDSTDKNLITWETAEQETPVAGECAAQIRIMQGTDDIGTARFVEYVEASPGFCGAGSESAVESLQEYVRQAAASAESASGSASSAHDDASAAHDDAVAAHNDAVAAHDDAVSAHDDAETASDAAETAQEVLDSIPADYSQLSSDVTALKTAINSKAPAIYPIASGSVATFPDGADGMPIKSLAIALEPIQEGSGDPSPTNVRPISGWTGCTVNRTGKNILYYTPGKLSAPLSVTLDTTRATYVKADVDYTFSFGMSNATNWRIGAILFDANGSRLFENGVYLLGQASNLVSNSSGQYYVWGSNSTVTSIKITPVYDCWVMLFWLLGDTSDSTQMTNAQMEPGSTASPYEPYHGISVQIPFGQTVYGGTLDPVKGELIVDRAIVDLGSLNWSYNSSGSTLSPYFYATFRGIKFVGAPGVTKYPFLCSTYAAARRSSGYFVDKTVCADGSAVAITQLQIKDSDYDNATDFKTAVTGQTLCYELEEPVEATLTAQELTTILGYNAIWSDAGSVSVEYPADTKTYIDNRINATRKLIAGIETGFIASKAYSVGDMLIIGDDLYKVASAIASGATITVGTNVTKTTVAEMLIALANA